MNTKKILASFLALAAACTMGFAAMAETTEPEIAEVAEESTATVVAKIGEEEFETIQAAVNAAVEANGGTIVLVGTIEEGSIKLPATVKNLTIDGQNEAVVKNTTFITSGGMTSDISNLTFNGIIFDNSNINFTAIYDNTKITNMAVTNCTFRDVNGNAAVAINTNSNPNLDGFTFTGNIIENVYGGSVSGLVLRAAPVGNITIADNEISNVAWNAIQVVGAKDANVVISGNKLASDADEGVVNLYGLSAVTLSGNTIDIKDGQPELAYFDAEAKIGNKYYTSFADALKNATSGDTVTLTKDLDDVAIILPAIDGVTIDGNGKKLTNSVIANEDKSTDVIKNFTIKNLTFDNSGIYVNAWSAGVDFANWTITKCVFENYTTPKSPALGGGVIQFNLASSMVTGQNGPWADCALNGFTLTDNIFRNITKSNTSALNSQAMEGEIVIENNKFDTVGWNAIQLQHVPAGSTLSIENNEFKNIGSSIIGLNVCGIEGADIEDNTFIANNSTQKYIAVSATNGAGVKVDVYPTIDVSENFWGYAENDEIVLNKNYTSQISGGTNYLTQYAPYYEDETKENLSVPAATIGEKKYNTIAEAMGKAQDGDIIVVAPGRYEEVLVVNKNVVITGDANYGEGTTLTSEGVKPVIVIKDATNGGVKYQATNVTFDNIVFEIASDCVNPTWIYYGALGFYSDDNKSRETLTVTNCDFINNSTHEGAIAIIAHIKNYTVTDCTFKNFARAVATDLDNSAPGNYTVSNNTYEDVATLVGGYWGKENSASVITIENNTSADNSVAKIEIYDFAKNMLGADKTAFGSLTVKNNAAKVILTNYAIDDFTADIAGNTEIVYTYTSEAMLADLANQLPNGTVYVSYGTPAQTKFIVDENEYKVEPDSVSVVFKANKEMDKDALPNTFWDIYLVANDGQILNRLNTADFTFEVTTDGKDKMAYEILATNKEIEINNVNNDENRYEFHYDGKTGTVTDTDTEIRIGTVKFTGYGAYSFKIVENETNEVITTKFVDSIADSFSAAANNLVVSAKIESEILVPTKTLTIAIDFPNEITNNAYDYQQMKVAVYGGELEAPLTIDLGTTPVISDITDATYDNKEEIKVAVDFNSGYTITIEKLLEVSKTYTVEVSGVGYRTAKYTVTMTDDKKLNFWNNVKDNEVNIEENKDSSAKNVTFLAGDIVKDNNINIYDLSAVVSYFGEIKLVENNKTQYAKYDLNRDGKIDSKDVAYVLVSWNK